MPFGIIGCTQSSRQRDLLEYGIIRCIECAELGGEIDDRIETWMDDKWIDTRSPAHRQIDGMD